jgi:hypothetical protein
MNFSYIDAQSNSECNCCRLVRSDKSSRLLLPLARRGRPHLPSRSHGFLCKNCSNIKRKQQNDILQRQQEYNNERNSQNDLNQISKHQMIEQDIPHEIEFSLINENEKNHLNNAEYNSAEMLVWKVNTSDNHNQSNTIDASYDTGSLTNNEKKILLQEAVQKLQIVLSNRSTSTTTTIPDSDLDKIEFTYRALQTTVNILSSSLDSL